MNSCSAVVPGLHLVHFEALEVHPDCSWSLLSTGEWAGKAQRRGASSGGGCSSAGGKDSGPALAMRARREGWHALTRAAGQVAGDDQASPLGHAKGNLRESTGVWTWGLEERCG